MVSLDRRFICQTIFSCCSVCVLGLAVLIAVICFQIRVEHLGKPIEVEGAQDIGMDWEKKPFVSATVVAANRKCPGAYPRELLYDIWLGLEDVCFC